MIGITAVRILTNDADCLGSAGSGSTDMPLRGYDIGNVRSHTAHETFVDGIPLGRTIGRNHPRGIFMVTELSVQLTATLTFGNVTAISFSADMPGRGDVGVLITLGTVRTFVGGVTRRSTGRRNVVT